MTIGTIKCFFRIRQLRWRRLTHLPLKWEIILALSVKVAILTGLWLAFFSTPQAPHMLLPTKTVEQHLLSGISSSHTLSSNTLSPNTPSAATHAPRASAAHSPSTPSTEVSHGSH